MRKALYIIVPAALLAVFYLVYVLFFKSSKADGWDFVPDQAALVWENDKGLEVFDSTKTLGIWSAFSELTSIKKLDGYLNTLGDASADNTFLTAFQKAKFLVAVCPTSATDLDALVVVRLPNAAARNYVKSAITAFEEKGFGSKIRTSNDFDIQELTNPADGAMFGFFIKGDFLIGSFTPVLLEDAIRAYTDREQMDFRSRFPELTTLSPLQQDQGNLYVNMAEMARLLASFSTDKISIPGHSSFLDVAIADNSAKLTGFTFFKSGLLTTFTSSPVSFELLEVVPNNTAILRHYSDENMAAWRSKLMAQDSSISQASDQLKSTYDVDVQFLFEQMKGELAVADLEIVGNGLPDRLVYFDTKDTQQVSAFLRQAAGRIGSDSLFVDRVGAFELIRISDPLFSRALIGARAELSTECYYMFYRNYVVLSNSLAQLKRLLQSIEADNTWRKSLRMGTMLDLANREANFTLLVNTPRAWNQFIQALKPEWKTFFQANEAGFKSLEYIGAQFSKVDQKFYTSITTYQPEIPRQAAKVAYGERAALPTTISTKPFVIRSHVDQSLEVLVQDSLHQMYHLGSAFDILWTHRLTAPIVGAIYPVDYYNNGKIQFAFVAGSQLHILDRNGDMLEGFPVKISAKQAISHFAVVDYDGSKNYRFMCTDADGNIYLLDKAGKGLDGWAPKAAGRTLQSAPRHIRIAGKDAFILVTKTAIDLVNRAGKSYAGFPVKFEDNIVGSYFTEATGSFETSKLTTLTEGGELIRINFSGRIEYREQLVKTAADTKFDLVPDVLENTFLVLKVTGETWEVLDAGGNRLFEKSYGSPSPSGVQFYRYGGDRTILLVSDRKHGYLSVYDLAGNVLIQQPLQTKYPASVIYFESQGLYQLYISRVKNVEKVRIN